jgi:Flp pilus assembly protein TadG
MQNESHNEKAKSNRRLALRTCARKLARDKEGVTAIEFALVALPFFTVVFAILELGLAFIVNRMVDNAVIEASRMIRTGQASGAKVSRPPIFAGLKSAHPCQRFLCKR